MKKTLSIILSIVMILSVFCFTASAEGEPKTVKVNMSQQGYANAADVTTINAGDGVTLTFSQGTNDKNAPKYYTSGEAVRMYPNNVLTVSSSSDTITGIVFSYVDGYTGDTFASNVSTGTYENGKWEGAASSVTFTHATTTKDQVRITEITVLLNGAVYEPDPEPEAEYTTPEEILAAAYELEIGATLSNGYRYTLEGVIKTVDYAYSNGIITVTMVVDGVTAENNTIYCFKMINGAGVTGVDKIGVNDHIKVTGVIKNYGGKVEFDQNCTLDEYRLVSYNTQEEIVNGLYLLGPGATLPRGPYTLTGIITSVDTEYSNEYGNVTVTIVVGDLTDKPVQCFRMKNGTGVDGADKVGVGDTITVKGQLTNYNGEDGSVYEFKSGCELTAYEINPKFMLKQLSLAGDIGMHFYMDLSMLTEDERADSYMEFTIGHKTATAEFDPEKLNSTEEYYGFTCRLNALQIGETVVATYHYGEDKTVSISYSIQDYIKYLEEHNDGSEIYNAAALLTAAIYNYGYFAQQYLHECNNVKLGEGGYAEISETVGGLTGNVAGFDINQFQMEKFEAPDTEGWKFTYCLLLDSKTAVELYITLPEGDTEDIGSHGVGVDFGDDDPISFGPDDFEDLGGGRYRLTISDISATELDKMIRVKVMSYDYRILCPLSYAYTVIKNNEDLRNNAYYCMWALVNLYYFANEYSEAANQD
ncbi:MAG: hypothetical protein J5585_10580 [Clostridia bacterium]|nr:hypothetical protein [Clostridia bacterium]